MKFTRRQQELRRVVVTGQAAITPLGLNLEETWANLLAGKSGIKKITKFDTEAFDTKIAGEIQGFNPELYIEKKNLRRMDTYTHYAIAATKMALKDAGLEITPEIAERAGTMIGVGMGGLPFIEEQLAKLAERGPGRLSPFFIPAVLTNMASGQASIECGMKGVNYSITSACATGAHSIGEAFNAIRFGMQDVMVAGGAESTICRSAIGGFNAMKALSTRNDDPETASRPYDKDRDGFVLSEGAGVVILEDLEFALKRGARILCEVTGYGYSSDAYHMTSPAPEGAGGAQAMRMALKDAGLKTSEIQYMNPHATSTPLGDELENYAIKNVFGEDAKKLWVNATKSMLGHTLGAAGAIESIICIQALKHQISPPTINLKNPSENCDLDYVVGTARSGKFKNALNNSFGFGGTNASLVFSTFEA